jgi:hypothetical protein
MLTIKNNRYSCVGIDGCKGKWVVVYITENAFEVEKFKTINDRDLAPIYLLLDGI